MNVSTEARSRQVPGSVSRRTRLRPEAIHYKYNVTVIRTWRTEDIMAIKKEKKAPQVTEIPEVSNYKEDLKEIKDLLKEICSKLCKLDIHGGF